MNTINIAQQFSDTPGGRRKADGPFSGEAFRERFLEDVFRDPDDQSIIVINLDGAMGYSVTFLEEAFGGLARMFGIKPVLNRLKVISTEDPLLEREILELIKDAV